MFNLIYANVFFFEHESHESDESFSLRLKMNIRLIRDIRGQEPAASGNACKSVYNPFASENKGQKNP